MYQLEVNVMLALFIAKTIMHDVNRRREGVMISLLKRRRRKDGSIVMRKLQQ